MREAVAGPATDQVDDAALASIEHRRRGKEIVLRRSILSIQRLIFLLWR